MAQVVKLTVYLTDLGDLGAFRRVRDEYISLDRPPASSLVQVKRLGEPRVLGGDRGTGRDLKRGE